jgi:multiple sugar transport system ATP-binding protein
VASIRFLEVVRRFTRDQPPAVDSLSLEIEDGEFLVLVGPSGCGKSTSLRMVAGLERVDAGSIWIGERDVTHVPPKDRDIAMVFQNYALYPHMSVEQNMGFALSMAGTPRAEARERVGSVAKMLALDAYLGRRPGALSGGQRQRVAMGRAIVRRPQVFLMDEPLSNLDAKLRVQTRTEISALQRRLGTTTIYVTHDQTEAMTMGDRVAVMNEGRLQQLDTPRNLYSHPANAFVAGFIGSPPMNLHRAQVENDVVTLGRYALRLEPGVAGRLRHELGRSEGAVVVGFRPEACELAVGGEDGLSVVVEEVEELGADTYVYGGFEDRPETVRAADVVARIAADSGIVRGQRVRLRIKSGAVHFFSATTGHALT